ncbi:MAG: hypothetical protein OEQ18_15365, partial [Gammaproteobacteria bacterium]|nr:hypothetical protein [Gammaproteobacteria bacterium]
GRSHARKICAESKSSQIISHLATLRPPVRETDVSRADRFPRPSLIYVKDLGLILAGVSQNQQVIGQR